MSIAIERNGLFHADVYHISSGLKFGYLEDGTLRIEVATDVGRVDLTPTDAKALRVWLEDNEAER